MSVGIFEAKNRLSELCEKVALTGEPLLIRRRGEPLVRIMPLPAGEEQGSVWSTVKESAAKYGPLDEDWSVPDRSHGDLRESPL